MTMQHSASTASAIEMCDASFNLKGLNAELAARQFANEV